MTWPEWMLFGMFAVVAVAVWKYATRKPPRWSWWHVRWDYCGVKGCPNRNTLYHRHGDEP